MKKFDKYNAELTSQFDNIKWIEESGVSETELKELVDALTENSDGLSKAMIKANTYKIIAEKSRICIDCVDIFQDKLYSGNLIAKQRDAWDEQVIKQFMYDLDESNKKAWGNYGAYNGGSDYGHTSPNSKLLIEIGVVGLLKRVTDAKSENGLSEKQIDFYNSCEVTLNAFLTYIKNTAERKIFLR